ncbi:MAG: hypothetical protein GY696_19810 [Gammaproteobacteria bacterium]|nr:hypothetical protein [Gammaproteobacteria bacterium]
MLSVDSDRVAALTGSYAAETEIHETYVQHLQNTTARVVPLKHDVTDTELRYIIDVSCARIERSAFQKPEEALNGKSLLF